MGKRVGFDLVAIPGVTYRVEYRDNLDDANWETLNQDVTANDSVATVSDPACGIHPQRFHRIMVAD